MNNTPENINKLSPNEVFIFGSNTSGIHGAGAAKIAHDLFGAKYGIGEGLMGQSYAFPTLDGHLNKLPKSILIENKEKLYKCANDNQQITFFLTKVGCGLAGFSEDEMKEIFSGDKLHNIVYPKGW